jgi:hypothetical protein
MGSFRRRGSSHEDGSAFARMRLRLGWRRDPGRRVRCDGRSRRSTNDTLRSAPRRAPSPPGSRLYRPRNSPRVVLRGGCGHRDRATPGPCLPCRRRSARSNPMADRSAGNLFGRHCGSPDRRHGLPGARDRGSTVAAGRSCPPLGRRPGLLGRFDRAVHRRYAQDAAALGCAWPRAALELVDLCRTCRRPGRLGRYAGGRLAVGCRPASAPGRAAWRPPPVRRFRPPAGGGHSGVHPLGRSGLASLPLGLRAPLRQQRRRKRSRAALPGSQGCDRGVKKELRWGSTCIAATSAHRRRNLAYGPGARTATRGPVPSRGIPGPASRPRPTVTARRRLCYRQSPHLSVRPMHLRLLIVAILFPASLSTSRPRPLLAPLVRRTQCRLLLQSQPATWQPWRG